MREIEDIARRTSPHEIFLVLDAMTGQDAVNSAKAFNDSLELSGVILTKLDGDARGGAAISVLEVTGAPILYAGIGETTDKFEEFRPEGMASRILGMGDVVGLMQDFEKVVDEKKAEQDAARMLTGDFTLDDFLQQVSMIQQMGSLKDLVDKLPLGGMFPGGLPAGVNLDDSELVRIRAIIQSMTGAEKQDPYVLIREPSRVARVSKGSGTQEQQVQTVIQQFLFMKQMMGGMGQDLGLLGKIPGMKGVASMRKMRKMMKKSGMGGGMPGMPGMGMPGTGMPGMGMPGMGMPGMGMEAAPSLTKKKTPQTTSEKNSRKAARRRQRGARKKGRR